MIEKGLKLRTCRATPRMEGGFFSKEVRMEGGRGSGGPASHTRTSPDLVPPRAATVYRRVNYCIVWIVSPFPKVSPLESKPPAYNVLLMDKLSG